MCAWIKSPRGSEFGNAGGRILSKRGSWEFAAPRFNGPISFFANGQHKNIGSTRVDDNIWHHVAVTHVSGTVNSYIDGRFDGSASFGDINPNTAPLWLGARAGNADKFHTYG